MLAGYNKIVFGIVSYLMFVFSTAISELQSTEFCQVHLSRPGVASVFFAYDTQL